MTSKPSHRRGEKIDVTVCAPPGFFANNPQVVRTDKEIVLAYGMQQLDKVEAIKTHQHWQPFGVLTWSISKDGGHNWRTTDLAPTVGKVLDCSYGEPLKDGGMVTMSFPRTFLTVYAYIQKGQVGMMPYNSHLPAKKAVPLTDFGPFSCFWFHSMTRTSDGALLAGGYATVPGSKTSEYCTTVFLRSRDEGRSWHYFSQAPLVSKLYGFSESGLLADKNGRVICLMRTDFDNIPMNKRPKEARVGYGYFLYQMESRDNGRTWSRPVELPIWGHPPYLLRLKSGSILLVYGHRRPPYSVRAILSRDNGKSWDLKTMRTLRGWNPGAYDLGYPQATQLKDGTILCTYYGYSSSLAVDTGKLQPRGIAPTGIFVSLFDEEWMVKG